MYRIHFLYFLKETGQHFISVRLDMNYMLSLLYRENKENIFKCYLFMFKGWQLRKLYWTKNVFPQIIYAEICGKMCNR